MTVRTMAVVGFEPPDSEQERPGRALLERIRFGLESFGYAVGAPEDDVFAWVVDVTVDTRSCLVRVGWTGDEWLVTLDPPPVGPLPRLRGLLGGDDPREVSERTARQLASNLHAVLGALGPVRWLHPEEHGRGAAGHALPVDD